MASGVKLNDSCMKVFDKLKMGPKKSDSKKFMVLKLSDDNEEIIVDEDAKYEGIQDFHCLLKELPADDGRYIVFDYPCKSKAGADTSKLILVLWCPESASVKKKMLYASSKSAVKKLDKGGDMPDLQCDCIDDVTEKDIRAKVEKI